MYLIGKATQFSNEFELSLHDDPQMQRQHILQKTMEFLQEEVRETVQAIHDNDAQEILDGFGDIAFIALNGIYKEFRTAGDSHTEAKVKTYEVIKRICYANLSKKHPDGSIIYANGKVQKPEGWQPPYYDDLI